jgi:hypothetical protein
MCVGRTLLSAAFDLIFTGSASLNLKSKSSSKAADKSDRPTRGLCQIEEQDLGVFGAFYFQAFLLADCGAVALLQTLAI